MRTTVKVLDGQELVQVHERSLKLLEQTGVRVESSRARHILADAGAMVDSPSSMVRFPVSLVEQALSVAPRQFTLGGRRPGWCMPMNTGECFLCIDGQAVTVFDVKCNERRTPTREDWLQVTRLIDILDEFGVYWCAVDLGLGGSSISNYVSYWVDIFRHFSKHVQESTENATQTRWLLEVLSLIFGGKETVRKLHPFSFLLCPFSPLVLEEAYIDAYLATAGWDIPVAAMPMPLMGSTSPASLIGTLVQANCEVLATLCLVQAACPGVPFIYAAVPSIIDPRSGRYLGGGVENAILASATVELARYYNLPCETAPGGTDHYVPGIQAGYERAVNWTLPVLSWPDILVGPGLLGGSLILNLEQLMIDLEIFRRCKRLSNGIDVHVDKWLTETIDSVGPGGNFLSQRSTRHLMHSEEWYISDLGWHSSYEGWLAAGRPTVFEQARLQVDNILAEYQVLPFDETVERTLASLLRFAEREETI